MAAEPGVLTLCGVVDPPSAVPFVIDGQFNGHSRPCLFKANIFEDTIFFRLFNFQPALTEDLTEEEVAGFRILAQSQAASALNLAGFAQGTAFHVDINRACSPFIRGVVMRFTPQWSPQPIDIAATLPLLTNFFSEAGA